MRYGETEGEVHINHDSKNDDESAAPGSIHPAPPDPGRESTSCILTRRLAVLQLLQWELEMPIVTLLWLPVTTPTQGPFSQRSTGLDLLGSPNSC